MRNAPARYVLAAVLALLTVCPRARADEFPAPRRERIEWCDIWFTDAEKNELPRVLLIGDSIARGYFDGVEAKLEGRAYCGRLTTSRSVCDPVFFRELELVLAQYRFSVIHVNNGLHGWGYTEEQYRSGVERLFALLERWGGGARVIWASTTPVREAGGMAEHAARVNARNAVAAELAAARGIPVDDLHSLVSEHPDWYAGDGVHFNEAGKAAQAAEVAARVAAELTE